MQNASLDAGRAAAPQEVNGYGWKALAGSAVGYAMDGFDLLILGFMLPAISKDLGLTPGQAGALVTWTLIGAVAGGIIFGALSDRFRGDRIHAIESFGIDGTPSTKTAVNFLTNVVSSKNVLVVIERNGKIQSFSMSKGEKTFSCTETDATTSSCQCL